jgi:hypothetical protein
MCTGHFPPGSPADWVAAGHVTCNIQRHGGCNRRIDVRLDALPLDQPRRMEPRLQGIRRGGLS